MRKKLLPMLTGLFFVAFLTCFTGFGQGMPVHIGKAALAPDIDGVVEAVWNDAPRYLNVDPHSWMYDGWTQGWFPREITMQTEEDFSVNWRALWDDTNLYFFFELTDDVVTTGDTASMDADTKKWMNDNIEMKIGPYFYRFAWGMDDKILQRPANGQFNPGGYTQKSVEVTGGYVIEVQIPWATLDNDTVDIGANPDVDSEFMLWVGSGDLDNPAANDWTGQDGQLHFPYDGGTEQAILALTADMDDEAPAVPVNMVSSDVTATSATLSWDAVADDDVRGYAVYEGEIAIKFVKIDTAIVPLKEEYMHNFSVRAFDGQNLSESSSVLAISTIPPTPDIYIGMKDAAVTVDGIRESAWGAAPQYVAVDPTTWTPNPDHQSLQDCSFKWSAVWDEDSLYIIVSVLDDIPTTGDIVTEGSSAISWMNDNVEVSIAPIDGEGDSKFFRFGYDREPADLGLLDSPPKNTPVGARYATADQDGGWVMEAAIPWKILSVDPDNFTGWADVDSVLNAGIYVADLDDPTATAWDKLSGHIQWPKGYSAADITLAETASIDAIPPAAPAGFAVSDVTFSGATLSWDASPESDIAGYLVLKGDAPMTYTANTSVELSLSAETEYTFSVHAVDPQNISTESEPVTFTTGAPPSLKSMTVPKYAGSYPNPYDDLDYWEMLPSQAIEYGTLVSDDFVPSFKTAWDDNNLYLQVSIVDPPPAVNGKVNPWENDNVEVHFDLQNAKDGTSCEDVDGDLYQKDNMQYRFIAYEPSRQHGSTPAPDWTDLTQVYYDLYDEAGMTVVGYYVEITFPWSTLNLTADGFFTFEPSMGKVLGVEIHPFDYDDDGSSAQALWSSYEGLPPNRNNTQYGDFILGDATGVRDLDARLLNVYPNPARNEIFVNIPKAKGNLTITDLSGRAVLNRNSLDAGTVSIDISGLSAGIYMITLTNGNDCLKSRLVVQK